MKQILTALAVLLLVGCSTPTAPEMPMEQSSADLGSLNNANYAAPYDPHVWIGKFKGSWQNQLGSTPVDMTILNVREDLNPIQVYGKATMSGVTFRILGNLVFDTTGGPRWVFRNVAPVAGCRAGDMTGELTMVNDYKINGSSKLVIIDGCMGLSPSSVAPTGTSSGSRTTPGGYGPVETEEPSLSGPCTLYRYRSTN